jgi:hypothetical protein
MTISINGTGSISGLSRSGIDLGAETSGAAFRVRASADQSMTSGANVKILFPVEERDTDNCFDTTLSRFTAPIDGDYHFDSTLRLYASGGGTIFVAAIFKNGTEFARGGQLCIAATTQQQHVTVSETIYLTAGEYIEIFGLLTGTTPISQFNTTGTCSRFSGFLVRPA